MASEKKAVGILVGGGPAPGINGVISAAAIEAINRGYKVYGIHRGFSGLVKGDTSNIKELSISDVSRIHSEGGSVLGTSRTNPKASKDALTNVVNSLRELNIGYLVTIGGDDTASSAWAISQAAQGQVAVCHVPKTIDNDLPLPGKKSTFGFQTARDVGTRIVETLMVDAKTTGRWYLVVAMGRKAGHLALGIGMSAGATLSLIPEEFKDEQVKLRSVVDIIVGCILKRLAGDRPHGVVVLAEGLIEKIDPNSIPELESAERDPHGHVRYAEIEFGNIVKNAVRNRLKEFGVELTIVAKDVGYELRCHEPNPFDIEYTRTLGYGAIDFLLGGGSNAMIALIGDSLEPIPFEDFIDKASGRAQVRVVDTDSVVYQVARKYQIRLAEHHFENSDLMARMALVTNKTVDELKRELKDSASMIKAYSQRFRDH